MNKFKVGDRVKLMAQLWDSSLACDSVGTVKDCARISCLVDWDGFTEGHLDRPSFWWVGTSALSLETEKVKGEPTSDTFIIIHKKADGRLYPANHPKLCSTAAQARLVAHLMTEKYAEPGDSFVVFKAIGWAEPVAKRSTFKDC